MCNFPSEIVLENGDSIFDPEHTDSHEDLIASAGLNDTGVRQRFVRLEYPHTDPCDPSNYILQIDEGARPDWFTAEMEQRCLERMRDRIGRMIVADNDRFLLGGCWILKDAKNVILKNGRATLYGSLQATLYGSSRAMLYGSSRATLHDSSRAELYGSSRATLHDSSQATLYGSSRATLYDSSKATLCDSSQATLYDSSQAELLGSSRATLHDSSRAELYGSSRATLHDSSRIIDDFRASKTT